MFGLRPCFQSCLLLTAAALLLHPEGSATADYEEALRQLGRGDTASAAEQLERIAGHGASARVVTWLVQARIQRGEQLQAEEFLGRLAKEQSQNPDPLLGLAQLARSRKDPSAAVSYAWRALAREPDSLAVWGFLSTAGGTDTLKKALQETEGAKAGIATRLFGQALIQLHSDQIRAAIATLERVQALLPDEWLVEEQLLQAYRRADPPATRLLLERIVDRCRRLNDRERLSIAEGRLGEELLNANEFTAAVPLLAEAANHLRELGMRSAGQSRRQSLALAYYYLGDYEAAAGHAAQAWQEAKALGHLYNESRALGLLATLSKESGDFNRAANQFEQALTLARQANDEGSEADLQAGLAEVYTLAGHQDLARRLARDSVVRARKGGRVWLEGRLLVTLATVTAQTNRHAEAGRLFQAARSRVRANGDVFAEGDTLVREADLARAQGRWQGAQTCYRSALILAQGVGARSIEMRARLGLGAVAAHGGEHAIARSQFAKALTLARELGSLTLIATSLNGLGRLQQEEGDTLGALASYREAIQALEQVRLTIAGPDERAALLSTHTAAYRGAIACLLTDRRTRPQSLPEAFRLAEALRARSLAERIGPARAQLAGEDPLLRKERLDLEEQIRHWQQRLRHQKPDAASSAALVQVQEAYRALQWRMDRHLPKANREALPEIDLTALQKILPPGTALLEYVLGSPRSWLLAITRDQAEAFPLPDGTWLQEQAWQWRASLEIPGTLRHNLILQRAQHLHQALLKPATRIIRAQNRLLICPDGVLHGIPFEALVTEITPERSWEGQRFILRRWEVQYTPSATVWLSLRGRTSVANDLLAFGAPEFGSRQASGRSFNNEVRPLPYSRVEVQEIARLYSGHAVVRLGTQATEARWKADVATQRFGILHLATHGFLNERYPWFSSLMLAASPQSDTAEDGLLQGYEVARLHLPAALVILSACETSLGRMVEGEGLIGLTHAFLTAGASGIVAGLWRVDDGATATLMTRLHQYLRHGQEAAQALRHAKLDLLSQDSFTHPYYWAGFVITGGSPEGFPQRGRRRSPLRH